MKTYKFKIYKKTQKKTFLWVFWAQIYTIQIFTHSRV